MDPALLREDCAAFQMYLMQDRKLLAESDVILEQLISELLIEKPDLVLITGDMTKDGELVCHQAVLKQLRIPEANKIKVLVVPGSHDINNPDTVLFDGDHTEPVRTISPGEFSSLYAAYGYGSAIARDPNSLGYIFEPFKDFFVLTWEFRFLNMRQPSPSRHLNSLRNTCSWVRPTMCQNCMQPW